MHFEDRRFARDSRFPFLAMNAVLRWQASFLIGIAIRQTLAANCRTVGELRDTIERQRQQQQEQRELLQRRQRRLRGRLLPPRRLRPAHFDSILGRIRAYVARIRSTASYWEHHGAELAAMVAQLPRQPTIYFTLTVADLHWPDLYAFLLAHTANTEPLLPNQSAEDVKGLSDEQRVQVLRDNADLVAFYVQQRMKLFFEHIVEPLFGVVDSWRRFEWQKRGSGHVHGVIWCGSAPEDTAALIC